MFLLEKEMFCCSRMIQLLQLNCIEHGPNTITLVGFVFLKKNISRFTSYSSQHALFSKLLLVIPTLYSQMKLHVIPTKILNRYVKVQLLQVKVQLRFQYHHKALFVGHQCSHNSSEPTGKRYIKSKSAKGNCLLLSKMKTARKNTSKNSKNYHCLEEHPCSLLSYFPFQDSGQTEFSRLLIRRG